MRICILACALCLLTSLVHADQPGFGPTAVVERTRHLRAGHPATDTDAGEFLINTSITYTGAPGYQSDPAVAFDGVNFLVVWVDYGGDPTDGIVAARVSPQGALLDPSGIVISTAGSEQQFPAVAFDGTHFLVVWVDDRSGANDDVYATRVTPDGVVLDPQGIPVSTAAYDQWYPAVAFDGTNFLVAWSDDWRTNPNSDICAARVTPEGTVLDPTAIAVSTAAGRQQHPTIACDGINSLVCWSDRRSSPTGDIYAARLTPQGTVLDPSGIVVSAAANEQGWPVVAFDGTTFLVAWMDNRSSNYSDVYAARITPQGTVLDPSGIAVSTAAEYQYASALAFDGTNFCVIWDDYRGGSYGDIYAARVTPAGAVLDPTGIPVSTATRDQYNSSVAFDGANLLVTWEDYRGNPTEPDIYAARMTPAGTVLDPSALPVSVDVGWQEYPAVAFNGVNFLVSWSNGRSDENYDICAARVTPAGAVLDSTGIVISSANAWQSDPVIASDGANYLVTWMDYRSGTYGDIYAARVTSAGTVLDPSGIPVSTAVNDQLYPAAGFDGVNFVVIWMDKRSGSTYDIYAARVTPAGAVLDPAGIVISAAANDQSYPAVAFDGVNSLVAWMDDRGGSACDVYAARLTPAGTVLDPSGIPVATAANDQSYPAVAFDGASFLVSWTDERSDSQGDIYGARVTPAGTVLDPTGIAISTVTGEQSSPDVAFDGVNWLVAWSGYQDDSTYDIGCAWVTPAGLVLDGGAVVTQAGDQVGPVLARGTGELFLAYQGYAGTVGGRTYDTDRIWGKLGPFPVVQEVPDPGVQVTNRWPTIVRGMFRLPGSTAGISHSLLDVSGRKRLDLRPGPNDVSRLAPGVYFVCPTAGDPQTTTTRLVLIR